MNAPVPPLGREPDGLLLCCPAEMMQDLKTVEGIGFVDEGAGEMLHDGRIAAGSEVIADDADMIQIVFAARAPEDDVAGLPVRLSTGDRQLSGVASEVDHEVTTAAMVDVGIRM